MNKKFKQCVKITGATGFLVPAVIGAITNNNMNLSAWMLVFGLAAAIHIIGNTVRMKLN